MPRGSAISDSCALAWAKEYRSSSTQLEIARKFGVSQQTVSVRLRKIGVETRRPGPITGTGRLGLPDNEVLTAYAAGRTLAELAEKYECSVKGIINAIRRAGGSVRSVSEGRLLWGEANAVGTTLKPSGYVEVTRGRHKGRGLHRVLMERKLGRRLKSDEHVHHINGVPSDNRIENLTVMSASDHAALHANERLSARQRNEKGQFV